MALITSLFACAGRDNDPSSTTSAPPQEKTANAIPAKNGESIVLDPAAKLRFESMSNRFDSVVGPMKGQANTPVLSLDEKDLKASVHKSGVALGEHVPLAIPATNGGAQ